MNFYFCLVYFFLFLMLVYFEGFLVNFLVFCFNEFLLFFRSLIKFLQRNLAPNNGVIIFFFELISFIFFFKFLFYLFIFLYEYFYIRCIYSFFC